MAEPVDPIVAFRPGDVAPRPIYGVQVHMGFFVAEDSLIASSSLVEFFETDRFMSECLIFDEVFCPPMP